MAGDRFSFLTYSDDNRGCVIKSDDQKNKKGPLPDRILWNSSLNSFPEAQFEEEMSEKKSMYDLLIDFYKYEYLP